MNQITSNKICEIDSIQGYGPIRLVIIQPTSYCNLDCDYCYLPERNSRKILSLELIKPIFQRIFECSFTRGRFTVCWHAGEPLTVPLSFYKQAFSIITELARKIAPQDTKIAYSVQTNGLLINQAWCDFFRQYPFKIGVSLDGPAFIHDAHRKTRAGLGSHQGTMAGIKLLQENKLDFQIIAVVTEKSLNYPEEMFNFFRENDINRVAFNIEEIEGINSSSSLASESKIKAVHYFFAKFFELTVQTKGKFQVREFEQMSALILRGKARTKNQLSHPFSIVNIDSQGNFSTFSPELLAMKSKDYQDFILGNVQNDSFESACKTDKFKQIYGDIRQGFKKCQDTCDYFDLCGGGAPSNKYWENGTFNSSETMACLYNKQTIANILLEHIEQLLGL